MTWKLLQDPGSVEKISKSTLPLICFRDGSPPLPDSSNKALKHLGDRLHWNLILNLAQGVFVIRFPILCYLNFGFLSSYWCCCVGLVFCQLMHPLESVIIWRIIVCGAVLGSLSNGSIGAIEGLQNAELCYPLEKRVTLKLTNEQVLIFCSLMYTMSLRNVSWRFEKLIYSLLGISFWNTGSYWTLAV